jgi:hypothetical protein
LGNAPVNDPAGEKLIEGGVDPVKGLYGGTNTNDNSGILRYVRVEFPGIAFQPNNEINGITFGGVGSATTVDYIMVSYSGDDSYEFFGGTVNAKHLIAYRGLDDDFDTDFGFTGKMQFIVSLRDSSVADISGSNGFESDNDASGTTNPPITNCKVSNATVIGPITGSGNTFNTNYKRGAHIRRSSKTSLYNSAIAGFPTGLLVDGANCEANANADELQVRNTVLAGCNTPLAVASGSSFDIAAWYNNATYGNSISTLPTDLNLMDPYNYAQPDFMPNNSSSLLSGADFSASALLDPFFDVVNYRGAFGTNDWSASWSNYNCQNSNYSVGVSEISSARPVVIYPNPVTSTSVISFELLTSANISLSVYDLQGRLVINFANTIYPSGMNSVSIPADQLNSGFYLLSISTESGSANYRFTKN